MKVSMLKSVRIDAGLGNPPSEYINNDPEAANFMIKHGLHFDAKKPHEFLQEIRNIIETQQRNENRAVFGKGPYKVRRGFSHLVADDIMWGQLSHEQRKRKLSLVLNAGIGDKKPGQCNSYPYVRAICCHQRCKQWNYHSTDCYSRSNVRESNQALSKSGKCHPKTGRYRWLLHSRRCVQ